ncbi:MAG: PEP-CTERM sorting domain-containing protein [Caldimonas sp.]
MTPTVALRQALAGFALGAIACGAHAQLADGTPGNLVTNGSMGFYAADGSALAGNSMYTAGSQGTALAGWSFLNTGSSAEFWNSFGVQSGPDGGSYLGVQDLDAYAPRNNVHGITQTIDGLTLGGGYELTFYSMSNHDGVGVQDWQVTFGGNTQTGVQTKPNANDTGTWVQSTMSFTATSASEALTFMAQYLPGSVPEMLNLDGVVLREASSPPVSAVPEPETYALFGIGLFALRFATRRKGRRSA